MEHLDASCAGLSFGCEIGELGGDEVFVTLVAAQGNARGMLTQALAISGRCIEVVHAMLDGIVNLLVDHLLVNLSIIVTAEGFAIGGRQAHHAVTQDGNLLVRLGILAIGHLAHRRFLRWRFPVITCSTAHDGWRGSCGGTQSQRLEEGAAVQHLAAFILVILFLVHGLFH